jgi:transcriptional regulator with XRE-family HTH domain
MSRKQTRVEISLNVPNLAGKLREARVRTGLTQKTAARKVGVTAKSVNHLECGLRGVTYELLVKLCRLYRVPVGQMIGIPELDELEAFAEVEEQEAIAV